jgi:hypothetical protein
VANETSLDISGEILYQVVFDAPNSSHRGAAADQLPPANYVLAVLHPMLLPFGVDVGPRDFYNGSNWIQCKKYYSKIITLLTAAQISQGGTGEVAWSSRPILANLFSYNNGGREITRISLEKKMKALLRFYHPDKTQHYPRWVRFTVAAVLGVLTHSKDLFLIHSQDAEAPPAAAPAPALENFPVYRSAAFMEQCGCADAAEQPEGEGEYLTQHPSHVEDAPLPPLDPITTVLSANLTIPTAGADSKIPNTVECVNGFAMSAFTLFNNEFICTARICTCFSHIEMGTDQQSRYVGSYCSSECAY